jgi:hypothetical protein
MKKFWDQARDQDYTPIIPALGKDLEKRAKALNWNCQTADSSHLRSQF